MYLNSLNFNREKYNLQPFKGRDKMPYAADREEIFDELVAGFELLKTNALSYEGQLRHGIKVDAVSNALFSLASHCQYYINKANGVIKN